jgi:hypothetical protein
LDLFLIKIKMNKRNLLLTLISLILIGSIGLTVQSSAREFDQGDYLETELPEEDSSVLVPSVLAGEDDFEDDSEEDVTDDDDEDTGSDIQFSGTSMPMGVGIVSPVEHPTLMALLEYLVRLLFWLGVTGMTLIVIYGAFLMITAGGDPAKFGKGQKVITYAVLGLILILLSWAIVAIIRSVLSTS